MEHGTLTLAVRQRAAPDTIPLALEARLTYKAMSPGTPKERSAPVAGILLGHDKMRVLWLEARANNRLTTRRRS